MAQIKNSGGIGRPSTTTRSRFGPFRPASLRKFMKWSLRDFLTFALAQHEIPQGPNVFRSRVSIKSCHYSCNPDSVAFFSSSSRSRVGSKFLYLSYESRSTMNTMAFVFFSKVMSAANSCIYSSRKFQSS